MSTSMSREELVEWSTSTVAFYGLELHRLSTVLLAQCFAMQARRIFSVFDLVHPIKVLEGLVASDGTSAETQFKYPPLRGLYKKHFTSARFMPKNIHNFLGSKNGKRHFEKVWDEAVLRSGTGIVDEIFIRHLVHHVTIDPIQIKSGDNSMTGEWVVFHKHAGKNYYLTLAAHSESNDDIHRRVILAIQFDGLPFQI